MVSHPDRGLDEMRWAHPMRSLPEIPGYEVGMRLADCLKLTGRLPEAVAVLEALKDAADRGEIPTQTRDLETRLHLFRALAR